MKTLILVAAMAVNAAAATVSYDYTGEVWSTWGADAVPVDDIVGITTGDQVVGSFTIDLDTVGTASPNPGNNHVLNYYDAITELAITVGDVDFIHDLDDVRVVGITNAPDHDSIGFTTIVSIDATAVFLQTAIQDGTAEMFSDLSLSNTINLPFGDNLRKLFNLQFFPAGTVNITWQTLTMRTPVPEPSAMFLLLFGLLIWKNRNVLRLRRPD